MNRAYPAHPVHLVRRLLVSFALALQFLTSAPELLRREASPEEVGGSMAWFPAIGALVGLALAGLDALLGLAFPEPLRSALVVAAMVPLTRGLHLDGLMDTCDGLFGGWTPERRLEIMRDSRVGSFGVLAAAGDLLLRFAALLALPAGLRGLALVLAPTLGRWALVYATWAFPYARPTGLGAAFKQHVGRGQMLAATGLGLVLCVGAALAWRQPAAAGLVALGWLAAWLVGQLVLSKVPGQTGDTYGATNEVVELAVLLGLCARVSGVA
jgi:adenosylcobinamide-GDP ribazoletransferase